MKCVICGQRDVDGAMDDCGEYVCVDCWANGDAADEGRIAEAFIPAEVPYPVDYPPEMIRNFLEACNQTSGGENEN